MEFSLNSCRLHGVCDENPVAPVIRRLGLTLYRTSGDDSVLYDHDLERYFCSLFTFLNILLVVSLTFTCSEFWHTEVFPPVCSHQ